MKTRSCLAIIITVTMALLSLNIESAAQTSENKVEGIVSSMAESPVDGSMWMGTAGNGLYRLSKTGSRLHFSASSGKIACDSIIYLCFDANAKLWILGNDGSLTNYSTRKGFSKKSIVNDKIICGIYLPKKDRIIFGSVTKLFTFNPSSETIESEASTPFSPRTLKPSADSSNIWVFGDNQVARLSDDGSAIEWQGAGSVSDSLPLEFETYSEERATGHGLLWVILAGAFGLALLVIIVIFVFRRRSPIKSGMTNGGSGMANAGPKRSEDYSLEADELADARTSGQLEVTEEEVREAERMEAVRERENVTKSRPASTEFTTRVLMLIEEHIQDPDFDVEAIAALTGMSRIHVNRKLKSEGAPSPSVMIKEKRMDRAKFFLLQSEMTMAQIASECGFRSPSYFTTAFKDYTGLTPSEFVSKNRL